MKYATTTDGTRRDFRLIKGDTPLDPCHGIPVHVCLGRWERGGGGGEVGEGRWGRGVLLSAPRVIMSLKTFRGLLFFIGRPVVRICLESLSGPWELPFLCNGQFVVLLLWGSRGGVG